MKLLVTLGLETPESINNKLNEFKKDLKSKNFLSLCALTILNSAYASRRLSSDSILLANGKILYRTDCPKNCLDVFDITMKIKFFLRELGLDNKNNINSTLIITKWIFYLKILLENDEFKLDDSISNVNETARRETSIILVKLSSLLKNACKIISYSNDEDLNELHDNSTDDIPKIIKVYNVLKDRATRQNITHAVIGDDGYLYNIETAEELIHKDVLKKYIVLHSGGGPTELDANSEDFMLDPISCEEIKNPVVANDGYIYNSSTCILLMQHKFNGIVSIPITFYIECPSILKW